MAAEMVIMSERREKFGNSKERQYYSIKEKDPGDEYPGRWGKGSVDMLLNVTGETVPEMAIIRLKPGNPNY